MRKLVVMLTVLLSVAVSSAQSSGEAEAIRKLIRDGRYPDAEAASRSLLARLQAAGGPESLEKAEALDLLVESIWQAGRYSNLDGRRLAEQAVAMKEKLNAPEASQAKSLFHLAAWYSTTGNHAEAKPLFERTLAMRERALGPNDPDVAFTLNVFGASRTAAGDYREARRLLERGLTIRETVLGPTHLDVAGSLNNLAVLMERTGNLSQCRNLVERALAIWEKELPPGHPRIGLGVANLAFLNASLGDHAKARPLFERALTIQEKVNPTSPAVALTLRNLAQSLINLGQLEQARPHLERSLAMFEKAYGPNHRDVGVGLTLLADFQRKTGDDGRARENWERGVAVLESVLGSGHPDLADAQFWFALLMADTGASGAAGELALKAEQAIREHARLTASTLPELEALQYNARRPAALHLALTLVVEGMDTSPLLKRNAFDAIVRSRAMVLDEMATRHRIVAGAQDPGVSRLAAELVAAREDLARRVVRGPGAEPPDRYKNQLLAARQQKDIAERNLAEKSLVFRNEQIRNRASLDDVRAALPPDGALVAFVRYRHDLLGEKRPAGKTRVWVPSYLALVLRSGESDPVLVPLGPAAAIDETVTEWRDQVELEALAPGRASTRTEAAYRVTAGRLREKAWDPVAPHLKDIKSVFVVPDGSLQLVNFAALPMGQTRYLIETGPRIHYLSAERDLVQPTVDNTNRTLLALGSPAFDDPGSFAASKPEASAKPVIEGTTFRGSGPDCATFESTRFAALPGSAREAQEIATVWQKFGGARVLNGSAATEAAFKREARGKRVLHLATHGYFVDGQCESAGGNPMLLSGLVLAGANHRQAAGRGEEDGILTAEEIAAMDLNGVEWAVLSACDTGVGPVAAGEGVFGLRRAFQVAGVRTLIMSLWEVEDQSARRWMTTLYDARFVKGLNTAQAVHHTGVSILTDRRAKGQSTHPFYWAGVVAAGDWR